MRKASRGGERWISKKWEKKVSFWGWRWRKVEASPMTKGVKRNLRGPENKVSDFAASSSSIQPSLPPAPLHSSHIWYSSRQSPSNNLPEVPATWKSISVIRHFCRANRNGEAGGYVRACVFINLCTKRKKRVQPGQLCPRWEERGRKTVGGRVGVTHNKTRRGEK